MMGKSQVIGMDGIVSVSSGRVRYWQQWAPYAAIAWSLVYTALGIYMAVSGRGFPYSPENMSDLMEPMLGQFGPAFAWCMVLLAGFPAAVMGVVMLKGSHGRALRSLLITAGGLLTGVLLLFMTSLDLLVKLGYIPYAVLSLLKMEKLGQTYLESLTQWVTIHQLLCFIGGFLWLAATFSYSRRSRGACLICGRREGTEGWQGSKQAARWGRIAVIVSLVAPIFYAFTRYAWALGFPLGMSEEYLRQGQENGMWTSGLFLATFGLVGAFLTLGLVQRWGETFPRWMISLAGRRVPIAMALVPAFPVSVLLIVGGITIWTKLDQMISGLIAGGSGGIGLIGEVIFQVGPTLLFPLWGVSLAVAALGYYFRRRGVCSVCGRGESS